MTAPAVLDPPAAVALVDLILARLLPAKSNLPTHKLRADLAPLFREPPSTAAVADALAELRADGLVTPKGQRLTDAGRARALAFLGVEAVPGRGDWAAVKSRCLLPMALGRDAPTDAKRLAALQLTRALGLPLGPDPTLGAALEAVACRELGFPEVTTFAALKRAALARAVGSDQPLAPKAAEVVVPRVLLNLARGGVRGAILADWVAGRPAPRPPADEPFDLEMFAATVQSAARDCPTGRFGGNKVFISHVWRQLRDEPRFAPLGLDGFKAKLVDANRADLLTLSRADLVQLMDPADVRESETTFLTAVFHFVAAEGRP
ncbi:MAG TPA: hypothetical protein VD866_17655 [Urbifossiella sp.]|nr:hypothetical protein [Urbifossiella sp.]